MVCNVMKEDGGGECPLPRAERRTPRRRNPPKGLLVPPLPRPRTASARATAANEEAPSFREPRRSRTADILETVLADDEDLTAFLAESRRRRERERGRQGRLRRGGVSNGPSSNVEAGPLRRARAWETWSVFDEPERGRPGGHVGGGSAPASFVHTSVGAPAPGQLAEIGEVHDLPNLPEEGESSPEGQRHGPTEQQEQDQQEHSPLSGAGTAELDEEFSGFSSTLGGLVLKTGALTLEVTQDTWRTVQVFGRSLREWLSAFIVLAVRNVQRGTLLVFLYVVFVVPLVPTPTAPVLSPVGAPVVSPVGAVSPESAPGSPGTTAPEAVGGATSTSGSTAADTAVGTADVVQQTLQTDLLQLLEASVSDFVADSTDGADAEDDAADHVMSKTKTNGASTSNTDPVVSNIGGHKRFSAAASPPPEEQTRQRGGATLVKVGYMVFFYALLFMPTPLLWRLAGLYTQIVCVLKLSVCLNKGGSSCMSMSGDTETFSLAETDTQISFTDDDPTGIPAVGTTIEGTTSTMFQGGSTVSSSRFLKFPAVWGLECPNDYGSETFLQSLHAWSDLILMASIFLQLKLLRLQDWDSASSRHVIPPTAPTPADSRSPTPVEDAFMLSDDVVEAPRAAASNSASSSTTERPGRSGFQIVPDRPGRSAVSIAPAAPLLNSPSPTAPRYSTTQQDPASRRTAKIHSIGVLLSLVLSVSISVIQPVCFESLLFLFLNTWMTHRIFDSGPSRNKQLRMSLLLQVVLGSVSLALHSIFELAPIMVWLKNGNWLTKDYHQRAVFGGRLIGPGLGAGAAAGGDEICASGTVVPGTSLNGECKLFRGMFILGTDEMSVKLALLGASLILNYVCWRSLESERDGFLTREREQSVAGNAVEGGVVEDHAGTSIGVRFRDNVVEEEQRRRCNEASVDIEQGRTVVSEPTTTIPILSVSAPDVVVGAPVRLSDSASSAAPGEVNVELPNADGRAHADEESYAEEPKTFCRCFTKNHLKRFKHSVLVFGKYHSGSVLLLLLGFLSTGNNLLERLRLMVILWFTLRPARPSRMGGWFRYGISCTKHTRNLSCVLCRSWHVVRAHDVDTVGGPRLPPSKYIMHKLVHYSSHCASELFRIVFCFLYTYAVAPVTISCNPVVIDVVIPFPSPSSFIAVLTMVLQYMLEFPLLKERFDDPVLMGWFGLTWNTGNAMKLFVILLFSGVQQTWYSASVSAVHPRRQFTSHLFKLGDTVAKTFSLGLGVIAVLLCGLFRDDIWSVVYCGAAFLGWLVAVNGSGRGSGGGGARGDHSGVVEETGTPGIGRSSVPGPREADPGSSLHESDQGGVYISSPPLSTGQLLPHELGRVHEDADARSPGPHTHLLAGDREQPFGSLDESLGAALPPARAGTARRPVRRRWCWCCPSFLFRRRTTVAERAETGGAERAESSSDPATPTSRRNSFRAASTIYSFAALVGMSIVLQSFYQLWLPETEDSIFPKLRPKASWFSSKTLFCGMYIDGLKPSCGQNWMVWLTLAHYELVSAKGSNGGHPLTKLYLFGKGDDSGESGFGTCWSTAPYPSGTAPRPEMLCFFFLCICVMRRTEEGGESRGRRRRSRSSAGEGEAAANRRGMERMMGTERGRNDDLQGEGARGRNDDLDADDEDNDPSEGLLSLDDSAFSPTDRSGPSAVEQSTTVTFLRKKYHEEPLWVRYLFIFVGALGFFACCVSKSICDVSVLLYLFLMFQYVGTSLGPAKELVRKSMGLDKTRRRAQRGGEGRAQRAREGEEEEETTTAGGGPTPRGGEDRRSGSGRSARAALGSSRRRSSCGLFACLGWLFPCCFRRSQRRQVDDEREEESAAARGRAGTTQNSAPALHAQQAVLIQTMFLSLFLLGSLRLYQIPWAPCPFSKRVPQTWAASPDEGLWTSYLPRDMCAQLVKDENPEEERSRGEEDLYEIP